jgi:hypothetical protein
MSAIDSSHFPMLDQVTSLESQRADEQRSQVVGGWVKRMTRENVTIDAKRTSGEGSEILRALMREREKKLKVT